jgi:hypothetical protein
VDSIGACVPSLVRRCGLRDATMARIEVISTSETSDVRAVAAYLGVQTMSYLETGRTTMAAVTPNCTTYGGTGARISNDEFQYMLTFRNQAP